MLTLVLPELGAFTILAETLQESMLFLVCSSKAYVLCMEWNSTTSSSCSHKSIQFHSVNLLSLREVATMLGPLLALVPRRMTNLYDPAVDPLWPEIEVCCRPCL